MNAVKEVRVDRFFLQHFGSLRRFVRFRCGGVALAALPPTSVGRPVSVLVNFVDANRMRHQLAPARTRQTLDGDLGERLQRALWY
jgi:hypothetical protein